MAAKCCSVPTQSGPAHPPLCAVLLGPFLPLPSHEGCGWFFPKTKQKSGGSTPPILPAAGGFNKAPNARRLGKTMS